MGGRDIVKEKNPNWKGNNVSYMGLHMWINFNYGNPRFCINCFSTKEKKYEWANISGKYRRDIEDFVRLCTKCHIAFDGSAGRKRKDNL